MSALMPGDTLAPGEAAAARRAYALHMARPRLSTFEISARLHDHGIVAGPRGKRFRCKRLRRLTAAYGACVAAGIEPSPETIFDD
jgi:hypothetical protein